MNMSFKMLMTGAALGLAMMSQPVFAAGELVGVAMPEKNTVRWIADGNNIKKELEAAGYTVSLQYADDDIPTQLSQIENMITKGAKVLVIAALDGTTLTDVLHQAHEKGIKVISYDRLIRNSPDVDYYATFDNFKVGVLQGTAIVEKLGLKDGKGPFNIELFGGSPDDNNAFFFYNGALSVLKPYLDSGKLVIQSKQEGMDKVGTLKWDGATAQSRMENLLSAFYTKAHVDAVLAPNDNLATGVISALKGVGYGSGGTALPVVTGQDAQPQSVKSIIAGEQAMTVFKDTRDLAKVAAQIVDASLKGKEPPINDTKTYDNGKKVVPSNLLTPLAVDKANYKKVLIDSGYYKESDLK